MKTDAVSNDSPAEDAIYFLSRKTIHPDPEQPRVHPDAELQASIDAQGIIQAITVRPHPSILDEWMIVDGECRWQGSRPEAELPCRIRYDLEDAADRIIAQLTANTGKPLAPIEQARAFRKIIEADPKITQVELAKRLGIPRSTVGDRVRMLELAPIWLQLLEKGKIQASHTATLQTYTPVPDKYQDEVAKEYLADPRALSHLEIGEGVPVDEFGDLMNELFGKHLRSLSKNAYPAWPENAEKYDGPVVERKQRWGGGKEKLAADPDIWRPILKRASSARAAQTRETKKSGGTVASTPTYLRLPAGCKTIKSSGYSYDAPKGFTEVVDSSGRWNVGSYRSVQFDVDVFMENVDGSKLAVFDSGGGKRVVTNDTAAFGKARSRWVERWEARRSELIAQLRDTLAAKVTDPRYAVQGRGASILIAQLAVANERDHRGDNDLARELLEIAEALGIDGGESPKVRKNPVEFLCKLSEENATRLASGFAAATSMKLDAIWHTIQEEQSTILHGYTKRNPNWKNIGTPAADTKPAVQDEDEPISAGEASALLDDDEDADDLWEPSEDDVVDEELVEA